MSRTPKSREQMCTYIQENKYIYHLVEVFDVAEKEENLDALHALCSCMQTIRKSVSKFEIAHHLNSLLKSS